MQRLKHSFAGSRIRLGGLLGALTLALGLVVFGVGNSPQASTRTVFRYPVEVMELNPAALRPEIELSGRVEAGTRQALIAAFDAWVQRVDVRPGQPVAAGELLAVLQPEHLNETLAAARLDLDNTDTKIVELDQRERYLRQRLNIEQDTLQRLVEVRDNAAQLRARAVITVMDYEIHRSAVDGRRLQVLDIERDRQQLPLERRRLGNEAEKLRTQIQTYEQQLAAAELRAPVAAVVTSVDIEPGAHVTSGHNLITLAPRESLQIVVPWPAEAGVDGLGVEAYALVTGGMLPLRVERVGAQIDAGRASPQGWLSPRLGDSASLVLGSHLQVRLQLPELESAYLVPESALYNGERVFRLDEKGESLNAVSARVAGQRYDSEGRVQWILASEQLRPGDRLLVSRLASASEGLPVDARRSSHRQSNLPASSQAQDEPLQ